MSGHPAYFLAPLVAATAAVILVILVVQGGYRDRGRGPFLAVLACLVLWAGTTFLMRSSVTESSALAWSRVVSVCLLGLFVTFAHFCHLYLGRARRWPVVLLYSVAAVLGGAVMATDLAVRGMTRASYGWAPRVGPLGLALFAGVCLLIVSSIVRLVRAWRHEVAVDRRRRLLLLSIAGVLPLAGIVADGFTDLPPVLTWANLAFCTLCTVAIVGYRLFALRAAARRGLVRLLVGTLITAPYVGAIIALDAFLGNSRDAVWVYVFSLAGYALVAWPAYEWARWRLERVMNSERYDHLQALRDLAGGPQGPAGPEEIASRLTAVVRRALNATTVSLLQPRAADEAMCLVATDGAARSAESAVLGVDSPLVAWLRSRPSALLTRTLAVEPLLQNVPQAETRALESLRASLIAPLRTARGALTGILVLGPRASRGQYSQDDLEFLENLGSEAAMAVENARLYRDALRSRETLEAWLNNLPDIVAIVDRGDVIRFLNREGVQRLATGPGQRGFLRAGPPEEGVPRRFTETIRGREYEIASAPLAEPGGQLSSVFVMRDITERKKEQAERQQLEARARLASHLASIGEMASGIAHEINNPLTSVIGYSQLLRDHLSLPPDVLEAVRQVHQGSLRVAGIVRRLLTFARQQKPRRAPVDLNEVIRSTLALRDYALRTGNIRVTTRLDPSLPPTVADAQQLQQVLLNLIVNAEWAMHGTPGAGRLEVASEVQGQSLHVVVSDDGPGVAPEIQERIFDPFFTTREVGEGTGLGLSICHGIMTEHGGRIWVVSDGVRGSAFHLQIPVVSEGEGAADAAGGAPARTAGPARLLVVDDEPSIREMLKAVLGPRGHQVDAVGDGPSAVERARVIPYGAIFLDVRMPVMSGLEVFRRLQDLGGSVASRVVFMTGDTMAEETRSVLEQTGAPALSKPFDAGELLQVLDRVLKTPR